MRMQQVNPVHADAAKFSVRLSLRWQLRASPKALQVTSARGPLPLEACRRWIYCRTTTRVTGRCAPSPRWRGSRPARRIPGSPPEANRTVVNPRGGARPAGVPQTEPPCPCITCPCKCLRIRPIAAGVRATPVDDTRAPRVHYRLPWASLMACSAGAKRRRSRNLPFEAWP